MLEGQQMPARAEWNLKSQGGRMLHLGLTLTLLFCEVGSIPPYVAVGVYLAVW